MHTLALLSVALLAADSPYDLDRVAVGAKPPAFELPSAGGEKLSLASLEGKNVVLVFYRGYW
jgi:cytochrome oxidase Cu insertion factor (SCO1/SenC/PrrC family)